MTAPAIEIPRYIVGVWDLDPVHSHVGFTARHMMVSKVRGRFDTFGDWSIILVGSTPWLATERSG